MKNITGTWELQSFEIEDLQGNRRSWGNGTQGLLLYTNSGHMSVSINKNVEKKSDNDTQNIFDSILFYRNWWKFQITLSEPHIVQARKCCKLEVCQIVQVLF